MGSNNIYMEPLYLDSETVDFIDHADEKELLKEIAKSGKRNELYQLKHANYLQTIYYISIFFLIVTLIGGYYSWKEYSKYKAALKVIEQSLNP